MQVNPKGKDDGENRVYRGGSWNESTRDCRVAIRDFGSPTIAGDCLGFRVALAPAVRKK